MPTLDYVCPVAGALREASVPDPARVYSEIAGLRRLVCPEEILSVLYGNVDIGDFPRTKFLALIQKFIGHLYVSASLIGDPKTRKPDFEKLEDVDEVWVMCFRDPKMSQWRLMGRFVERDYFVGLCLFCRTYLGNRRHYNSVAEQFAQDWVVKTGNMKFLRGTSVNEYFSKPCGDVYAA